MVRILELFCLLNAGSLIELTENFLAGREAPVADRKKELGFKERVEYYRQVCAQKEGYLAKLRAHQPQSDEQMQLISQWEEICSAEEVVFYSILEHAAYKPDEAFKEFASKLLATPEEAAAFLKQNNIKGPIDSQVAKRVQNEFVTRFEHASKDPDFNDKFKKCMDIINAYDEELCGKVVDYLMPIKFIIYNKSKPNALEDPTSTPL